jgi:hypothetical protein
MVIQTATRAVSPAAKAVRSGVTLTVAFLIRNPWAEAAAAVRQRAAIRANFGALRMSKGDLAKADGES